MLLVRLYMIMKLISQYPLRSVYYYICLYYNRIAVPALFNMLYLSLISKRYSISS